jgi:hypothetical protein
MSLNIYYTVKTLATLSAGRSTTRNQGVRHAPSSRLMSPYQIERPVGSIAVLDSSDYLLHASFISCTWLDLVALENLRSD